MPSLAVVAALLILIMLEGLSAWGVEILAWLAAAGGVAGGAVWFSWLVARRPRIAATVDDDGQLTEQTLPPEGLAALAGPEAVAAARQANRWIHPYYLVGCVAPLVMCAVLPWQYLEYYSESADDPSMATFFALFLRSVAGGHLRGLRGRGKDEAGASGVRLGGVAVERLGVHAVGSGHRGQRPHHADA